MTLEQYENIVGQVAREFHDEYIGNGNRDEADTLPIAVEYTMFILKRFSQLVEEFEDGKEQDN